MDEADKLYAGALNDLADSMAQEMDKALATLMDVRKKSPPPAPSPDLDRQMLFVAIARGVINHLQQHQKAFQITIPAHTGGIVVTPAIQVRS